MILVGPISAIAPAAHFYFRLALPFIHLWFIQTIILLLVSVNTVRSDCVTPCRALHVNDSVPSEDYDVLVARARCYLVLNLICVSKLNSYVATACIFVQMFMKFLLGVARGQFNTWVSEGGTSNHSKMLYTAVLKISCAFTW